MSWRGSVHCSFCGQRGHNRLGCPERKKEARENPDGYVARALKREATVRQQAVANRRCSYCGEAGHNRRGCALKKRDVNETLSRISSYRTKTVQKMAELGIGIGSIIQIPATAGSDRGMVMNTMITGIDWHLITHRLLGAESETGIHDADWSLRRYEKSLLKAVVVSHNVPEEHQRRSEWYQPGHKMDLDIVRFAIPGLHPTPDTVNNNYQTVSIDQWKYKVVGPIKPNKVAESVPEGFYDEEELPGHVLETLNFQSGWRAVEYKYN